MKISKDWQAHLSRAGKLGGAARAAALSPQRRKAIAKKAARAKAEKFRLKQSA